MKICPNCQRTYTDDGLNFCLEDGSMLSQTNSNPPGETSLNKQPRAADPNQPIGYEVPTEQAKWSNAAAYSMQPKKSSKAWIWVLGIVGGVILLCGGGFVGFVAWVGSLDTNSNSSSNNTANARSLDSKSNPNTNSAKTNDRVTVQTVDLNKWVITNSEFGITECTNGKLTMSSRKKGFYYVIAGTKDEKTESANSKVTLTNVEQASTTFGYGLVVHSNPTPLQQSYAFLIDSINKRYRIVYHQPGKETAAVNWTNSSAINGGKAENTLEVRDNNGKMEFYINDNLITNVKNVYGYKDGVVGLYSADAVKIVFSNLEIRK